MILYLSTNCRESITRRISLELDIIFMLIAVLIINFYGDAVILNDLHNETYSTLRPVDVGYIMARRSFFDGSITYKDRTVFAFSGQSLPSSSNISNFTANSRFGSAIMGNGKSPLISRQYDLISWAELIRKREVKFENSYAILYLL